MSSLQYLLTPFFAWFIAGTLKFLINSLKARRFAFDLIGYGGLPSNHSAIVASMAALIGLNEGLSSPAFGVAITLAFIVILDASSLRRQMGKHAAALNKIIQSNDDDKSLLRERMGHTPFEIICGLLIGILAAILSRALLS